MDVDLDQDDKLSMVIGEFGDKGELIFTKLLAWIYKNYGYYVVWDEQEELKFAKRVAYISGSSVNLNREIISRCIKWGIFNTSVFESFQILTSKRIQNTWYDATRKRKGRIIYSKIWVKGVNDALETETIELLPSETPQSKVNKSKLIEANASVGCPPTAQAKDLKEEFELLEKTLKNCATFIDTHRPSFADPYAAMWNAWVMKYRDTAIFGKVSAITEKRKKNLSVRIKEKTWDFAGILRKAALSNTCITSTWFSFDWITENQGNYLKVLEGNYDNNNPTANIAAAPITNAASEMEKRLLNRANGTT